MRQHVGWITWGGTRALYDDGTVGQPLNDAIRRTRNAISDAFPVRPPVKARRSPAHLSDQGEG